MPSKKLAEKPAPANSQKGKKICTCCHKSKNYTDFYLSYSPMYSLDKRTPICKECCKKSCLTEDGTVDMIKLKELLRQIDKPLYFDLISSAEHSVKKEDSYVDDTELKYRGYDILSKYFTLIAMRQDRSKSYTDSEKENFMHQNNNRSATEKKQIIEKYFDEKEPVESGKQKVTPNIRWTNKDKQNMKYVITTVGYDPFEDLELSEQDRKYCFNIMAGYCDTDGIIEDGNKMQGVIEMTNMYCQCKNFTAAINAEMGKKMPDDQKIQRLTSAKTSMLSSISTIAKDNNIASNYNKNSKQGQNSLTSKMKEIEENDFEMIKVNFFDIKTSEAFKQIADLSNQSIMEQLTFDNNDYCEIVKEQKEMIHKYELDVDILKEENRNLKNKIIDLERSKR